MIAHLDASTGISGDKFLAALLDAGAESSAAGGPAFTLADLSAAVVSLAPEARVTVGRALRGGVDGMTLNVESASESPHRSWRDIRARLDSAEAPESVRRRAVAVFARLADAEARVHGVAVDDVHFHEVGAVDSIADVLGVCLGLEALGITRLVVTPVAVGSGTVETAHGVLPVPAPATALLLRGVPVVPGTASGELTTPTGAALVAELADSFGPLPPMVPLAVGHGAGAREIPGTANVARIVLGKENATSVADGARADSGGEEPVTLLETTLDHLSPEAVAFAADELGDDGALDVWTSAVAMKKRRLGVVLSVLAREEDAARLTARIHQLTGTLGVRRLDLVRSVMPRQHHTITSEWGVVHAKTGAGRTRPEADDVARVARHTKRAFDVVERELASGFRDTINGDGSPGTSPE